LKPVLERNDRFQRTRRNGQQGLYLVAALHASQTPFTKVLAVVADQAVMVFTHPGSRSADYLVATKVRRRIQAGPDRTPTRESIKRYFFDRTAEQSMGRACVVNDFTFAYVDSVMKKAAARRDDVRTRRKYLHVDTCFPDCPT
jgi:hypothetical protein